MERWPFELKSFLLESLGRTLRIERIGGVAGSGCVRVSSAEKSVIVKMARSPRERQFYETHAPFLRTCSVGIPELYFSGCSAGGLHYIVMEYIPHSLPQNQWIRNMEQVETLFALHHCTWGKQKPAVEDPFRPGWTEDMTNTVLGCFARSMKAQVLLERLRKAQTLWQHMNFLCCITGDPNPTNWCVRDDGKLVLVDWERFGYGTPAVDLAILMPGLGSQDGSLERWLATEYVKCWLREEGFAPISVEVLQAQIRLAKLWSAVEFVTETSTQPESYQHRTRRYLVNNLQNLLQEIECIEKVLA